MAKIYEGADFVAFGELRAGDIFKYQTTEDNIYCIKINMFDYNAIGLKDGTAYTFEDINTVIPFEEIRIVK